MHNSNLEKKNLFLIQQGRYGFKRFFRDGYGTVLEETSKRFYERAELKVLHF